MEFDFKIIAVDSRGYSQVLYRNVELGETRVFMYLPIEKGEVAVKAEILNNLPRQWFRAKRRALTRESIVAASDLLGFEGKLNASIEDAHHDFQTQAVVDL